MVVVYDCVFLMGLKYCLMCAFVSFDHSQQHDSLCVVYVDTSSVVFSKVDETTFFDPPFLLA